VIERREHFLSEYQNKRYGRRYRTLVERVRTAEDKAVPGSTALTDAVARSLFKLMSYKDEYEVARLYTNGHFEKQVASAFEGDNLTYEFHLAPPLFARKDPVTGVPRKMSFGPWMMKAFRVLAGLKPLRGTPLDVFGYTHERRTERGLIREFEGRIEEIVARLNADNHPTAVGLAGIPQKIRGFGHIKEGAGGGPPRQVPRRSPAAAHRGGVTNVIPGPLRGTWDRQQNVTLEPPLSSPRRRGSVTTVLGKKALPDRSARSCILSGYGSRAPLRGPGMTGLYSSGDPGSALRFVWDDGSMNAALASRLARLHKAFCNLGQVCLGQPRHAHAA
jgi:hypothetical protein